MVSLLCYCTVLSGDMDTWRESFAATNGWRAGDAVDFRRGDIDIGIGISIGIGVGGDGDGGVRPYSAVS